VAKIDLKSNKSKVYFRSPIAAPIAAGRKVFLIGSAEIEAKLRVKQTAKTTLQTTHLVHLYGKKRMEKIKKSVQFSRESVHAILLSVCAKNVIQFAGRQIQFATEKHNS